MPSKSHYRVVILGSGPAGLTAALYASRAELEPLVIEEMFPLKCSIKEMDSFIKSSGDFTDGWISFYWGKTIAENEKAGDIKGAIIAKWLQYFRDNSPAK